MWQRPQQILARLASHHHIAIIEEPIGGGDVTRLDISEPLANVVRIVPHLRGAHELGVDARCAALQPLIERAFREHPLLAGRFRRVIQWFYSPMTARFMLSRFDTAAVVYDCMDELSKFRFAPADLPQREAELLAAADVVFTGGYQLFSRKSQHHHNVHFFGCGVDLAHYAKARAPETPVPHDVASLPHPMLGYFGVIDERLDYGLIDALADACPQGSVVMIGPFAKIDPAALPQRPNLHWLGQRGYDDLPAYVKAFDVCLMPFALNEATENINPTKTLEYMAGGKPVVSTAIADVVHNFSPPVRVAYSQAEFLQLAHRASVEIDLNLILRGLERARRATWDSIVAAMHGHVLAAVRSRQCAPPRGVAAARIASAQ